MIYSFIFLVEEDKHEDIEESKHEDIEESKKEDTKENKDQDTQEDKYIDIEKSRKKDEEGKDIFEAKINICIGNRSKSVDIWIFEKNSARSDKSQENELVKVQKNDKIENNSSRRQNSIRSEESKLSNDTISKAIQNMHKYSTKDKEKLFAAVLQHKNSSSQLAYVSTNPALTRSNLQSSIMYPQQYSSNTLSQALPVREFNNISMEILNNSVPKSPNEDTENNRIPNDDSSPISHNNDSLTSRSRNNLTPNFYTNSGTFKNLQASYNSNDSEEDLEANTIVQNEENEIPSLMNQRNNSRYAN